ncbi:hypothetical protein CHGG_05966 [Chaetomium globosum CBS 148.51]|uniref:Uncharacterized protein n=1 Tax=Chaetomium globosum (strain ATCC 6205 / CBS 148.51 / DSM 1962 / NBRC 6347 / NRRL 1970) TaxID=306901 RepID=Q2H5U9_CHAGB|nr:uncharacterized protein CHGG_05966 [Chaetomium globosum CBS 148.51]EAQ89347.1 hypothetical protein CHGG_05966 [Chaetomium globosum CBS 148.51]
MVWSATDLDPESGVACRQCATEVVCSGSVKVWKDLPSENWAEMMEFWHCHKPDHHHHHNPSEEDGKAGEESLAARGYGASSAISAQEGVGFVDLTTLLFEERDCQNVTIRVMANFPVHAGYWAGEPPSGDGSLPPADSLPSALRQIILKWRLLWDYWRDMSYTARLKQPQVSQWLTVSRL